jgi:DNA-binding winged helix-turn-helix (wHTH) protein
VAQRGSCPPCSQAFDVLAYLVEHAGRLVTQDEILEALWSETYVNPEVLRKYILEIRRTLGDRPDSPEFIETVPKRGYRFVAPVLEESTVEPPVAATSSAIEQLATEENAGPAAALQKRKVLRVDTGCGCLRSYQFWRCLRRRLL